MLKSAPVIYNNSNRPLANSEALDDSNSRQKGLQANKVCPTTTTTTDTCYPFSSPSSDRILQSSSRACTLSRYSMSLQAQQQQQPLSHNYLQQSEPRNNKTISSTAAAVSALYRQQQQQQVYLYERNLFERYILPTAVTTAEATVAAMQRGRINPSSSLMSFSPGDRLHSSRAHADPSNMTVGRRRKRHRKRKRPRRKAGLLKVSAAAVDQVSTQTTTAVVATTAATCELARDLSQEQ